MLLTVPSWSQETNYDVPPAISPSGYAREYNNPSSNFLYYSIAGSGYRVDVSTMPPPAPVFLGVGQ